MIRIAVIGLGYWGPNYVRVFSQIPKSRVDFVCDLDDNNLKKIKKMFPQLKTTKNYHDIPLDKIDAVVIVTPPDTHLEIAEYFLKQEKDILVEKPLTPSYKDAFRLIEFSKRNKCILMTGHVYLFNLGIIKLKEFIKDDKFGDIYYIKTERMALGPIRKKGSVLWDLAIHDVYILLYLLERLPQDIAVYGSACIQKEIEDFITINLKFPSNILCNINASWFAPEKIRTLTIIGSKAMAVFDDVNKSEMLKIYERKINKSLLDTTPEYSDHQNIVSIGDVYLPNIKQIEPLRVMAEHFLECIEKRIPSSISGGEKILDTIKVVENIEKILKDAHKRC